MPLLDMPLAELKEYMGQTACPPDFDQYWRTALKEADEVNLNVELRKIYYPVDSIEAFNLFYNGTRKARIHALYVKPKTITAPGPCVLEFHGYSGNCGTVESKLKWTTLGYQVLAMDCRGQGGQSVDVGGIYGTTMHGHIIRGIEDKKTLLFKEIFLDAYLLAKTAASLAFVDNNRILTSGASQGGALALVCSALFPTIKKTAACHPFLCDYHRAWEMDCGDAYREISEWFRSFDPAHVREAEIFERLGYIDVKNFAPRIKADVLTCTGLRDDACPPSTVYAMYNHLRCIKNMIVYPDYYHEKIDHWNEESFKFLAKI